MERSVSFLPAIWSAIGEVGAPPVDAGGLPALPSRLATAELVRDSVAAASRAAALLVSATDPPEVTLDARRVRTAVTSERHFTIDGRPPDVWAELSGFWPARNGWVRTHANYPHHRARLLHALELPADSDSEEFASRAARFTALEIEDRVADAGGVAVAVRQPSEWRAHPHAAAVNGQPLVDVRRHGTAREHHADPPGDPLAPLSGVRVLDLTRVIAGPVATRTLALLGADVLRVDDPTLAEPGWQHLDTGAAKRSTLLNLRSAADRAAFDALLAEADVLVLGYRPSALDRFGLAPDELRSSHPGLVIGGVTAWGRTGPWAGRRGFDSIVQAATGIARIEAGDAGKPGALPAQALDHSAGYTLAAGILSALRHRKTTGAAATVQVSLVRLAHELLAAPRASAPDNPADADASTTTTVQTPAGRVTYALPALHYAGAPCDWPAPSRPHGADAPRWAEHPLPLP